VCLQIKSDFLIEYTKIIIEKLLRTRTRRACRLLSSSLVVVVGKRF